MIKAAYEPIWQSHQVLKWYFAEFQRYLAMGATRLMVIGYGFNDLHINTALLDAAPKGLKIFIIDPFGVDAGTRHVICPFACRIRFRTSSKARPSGH